jgi:hypothetical protein
MRESKLKKLEEMKEKLTRDLESIYNKIEDLKDDVDFEITKNDEGKFDMCFTKGEDEFHVEDVTYESLVDMSNKIFQCVVGGKINMKRFTNLEDFFGEFEKKFNGLFR